MLCYSLGLRWSQGRWTRGKRRWGERRGDERKMRSRIRSRDGPVVSGCSTGRPTDELLSERLSRDAPLLRRETPAESRTESLEPSESRAEAPLCRFDVVIPASSPGSSSTRREPRSSASFMRSQIPPLIRELLRLGVTGRTATSCRLAPDAFMNNAAPLGIFS